jgi:hypothetical protein
VTVGVIDSGVDLTHPDIAPNLDLALSCSFITSSDPVADPSEVANGDCSNKSAIQDLYGHGTHVASIIGAPVNGIGIAGVAPDATLVALKACSVGGFCFVDEVAAALRYAGDHHLDIVNLSLFADPYLYYCGVSCKMRRGTRSNAVCSLWPQLAMNKATYGTRLSTRSARIGHQTLRWNAPSATTAASRRPSCPESSPCRRPVLSATRVTP